MEQTFHPRRAWCVDEEGGILNIASVENPAEDFKLLERPHSAKETPARPNSPGKFM